MEEALSFFRAFEIWIYLLLGLGGLIYLRKFVLSWRELREAGFGLERDSAQSRLNQAVIVLVLLLSMAVTEFVLVSFIAPSVPGANLLPTPTLNLLATATTTLPAGAPTSEFTPVAVTAPPESAFAASGCVPGEIEISSPSNGQEVNGVVEVLGTASIANFGFYKIESRRPDELTWLTQQAGNTIIQGGKLGDWDTRRLTPGEYQLGLVVVDNQARLSPPCIVQVRVSVTPLTNTEP
ncbi:MAG: hypothetical protein H6Q38_2107 [Chloroflexi bacterium]|nr:hypothetical protein [Chloroflexota bacterium]